MVVNFVIQDDAVATYKTQSICTRVRTDVLQQLPTRHPNRDGLERRESHTQEGDNVWVHQTFPRYGLLAESLWVSSDVSVNAIASAAYTLDIRWPLHGVNP